MHGRHGRPDYLLGLRALFAWTLPGRNLDPISRTPFASPGVGEPEGVIRLEPGARFSATFVRVSEGTIG